MTAGRTYLDHNATTPLRAEARAAMLAALDMAGNASSVHAEGRQARGVIETAREQVAALVGAKPEQVVFTSGATEANNWALAAGWSRIVVSGIEHESVLEPARASGAHLDLVGCSRDGRVVAGDFKVALGAEASSSRHAPSPRGGEAVSAGVLVSLQAANSETGVLQPLAEVAALARAQGAAVHCDAVQAAGRVALDMGAIGVDLMSVSAHKLGGPKGVGALVIRDGLEIVPYLRGGSQERRRRAGTENIAAIAGFGAAAIAARAEIADIGRLAELRDRLERGVAELTPTAVVIGADAARLANTSCIALTGAQAAMLLIKLDLAGIAVSAGSACSSGKIGGSHVLAAMGVPKTLADCAIRVSLGRTTTDQDIARFLAAWAAIHKTSKRFSNTTAPEPAHATQAGE